jgi:hypothetical protein
VSSNTLSRRRSKAQIISEPGTKRRWAELLLRFEPPPLAKAGSGGDSEPGGSVVVTPTAAIRRKPVVQGAQGEPPGGVEMRHSLIFPASDTHALKTDLRTSAARIAVSRRSEVMSSRPSRDECRTGIATRCWAVQKASGDGCPETNMAFNLAGYSSAEARSGTCNRGITDRSRWLVTMQA